MAVGLSINLVLEFVITGVIHGVPVIKGALKVGSGVYGVVIHLVHD